MSQVEKEPLGLSEEEEKKLHELAIQIAKIALKRDISIPMLNEYNEYFRAIELDYDFEGDEYADKTEFQRTIHFEISERFRLLDISLRKNEILGYLLDKAENLRLAMSQGSYSGEESTDPQIVENTHR